jgi:hypothetical protein
MPIIPVVGSSSTRGAVVPIASSIASGVNTVTFNNIPQNFRDLYLVSYISAAGNTTFSYRINSDSSALYNYTMLIGRPDASAVTSTVSIGETLANASGYYNIIAKNNTFTVVKAHFPNYANTTDFKSILQTYGQNYIVTDSASETGLTSNIYRSTNAVTSLTVFNRDGANWNAGTSISLYGVRGYRQ